MTMLQPYLSKGLFTQAMWASNFAERCDFNRKFPISSELKSHRSAKLPTPHHLYKHPLRLHFSLWVIYTTPIIALS